MIKRTETALDYFKNNFNCAQSVLCAFAPELGISKESSMKIACAFGGGIGRQQLTCGAVTGALMVLGLKYGKGLTDDNAKKLQTYEKSVLFMNEFKKKHKSITCRELLKGLDMVADADKIKELGLYETLCTKLIKDAVTITGELLHSSLSE
jgi:C_GCAxxG_C_C family probable redox protein